MQRERPVCSREDWDHPFNTNYHLCTYKHMNKYIREHYLWTEILKKLSNFESEKRKKDRRKNKQVTQRWRDRPDRRECNKRLDIMLPKRTTTVMPSKKWRLLHLWTFHLPFHATWKWDLVSIMKNKAIRSKTTKSLHLTPYHHQRIRTVREYKAEYLQKTRKTWMLLHL